VVTRVFPDGVTVIRRTGKDHEGLTTKAVSRCAKDRKAKTNPLQRNKSPRKSPFLKPAKIPSNYGKSYF